MTYWLICALLLAAADPAWVNKPTSDWTEEDAREILTDSPWSMTVIAGLSHVQTEDERREGGNMGQPHGIGIDGVDGKESKPRLPAILGGNSRPASETVKLRIRWETALPVRVAELKAREIDPPTLQDEGYQIAVYDVPGTYFKGDPRTLGNPLKKTAWLKRDGKKDVTPSNVEVFERQDGMVVVYEFPLSAEISRKDTLINFEAVIGRIVLRQVFDVRKMQLQGKLEL